MGRKNELPRAFTRHKITVIFYLKMFIYVKTKKHMKKKMVIFL